MLKKITGKKLYEQVVEQIKDMIDEGIYTKGNILPSEKELIDITGVSRITIREALKILADAGIIETIQGKGSIVLIDSNEFEKTPQMKETKSQYMKNVIDSTNARLLIEPEIAKQAAKIATSQDIKKMEMAISNKKLNLKAGEFANDFHLVIADIVKVSPISKFLKELIELEEVSKPPLSLIEPENQKEISKEIDLQHRKILNAIKEHNSEFAYFYMKEHQTYLLEKYEEYFRRFFK